MKGFKDYLKEVEAQKALPLDVIFISHDGETYRGLDEERKWISGRFSRNIGIDQAAYGAGQTHGHVYGRKGKEILAVNIDGTASHGTTGKLHDKDAAALRAQGFTIRDDNLVEWWVVGTMKELLLG